MTTTLSGLTLYTDEWTKPEAPVDTSHMSAGTGLKLKNPQLESFWVTLIECLDDGNLVGKVNSHLVNGSDYNYGDLVLFNVSDVRSISTDDSRREQLAFIIQLVLLFEQKMGRRPTVEEIDRLTTTTKF